MTQPQAVHGASAGRLALAVFFQMLPATLVAPAIRPLFERLHGGDETAMHAFMAVNMLGGLLAAPWLGAWADRGGRLARGVAWLAAIDALLLGLLTLPLGAVPTLVIRCLEGAAHVGAASLLLTLASSLRRTLGDGRAMGWAGAGLMGAIALGSAAGGALVVFDCRLPFWGGALLSLAVALWASRATLPGLERARPSAAPAGLCRSLAVPISAAFLERFTVGCLVVTFGLFVHRGHGLSDAAVGYLFSAFTLPFAALMYPVGRLGERLPRALLLGTGTLLYGAALMGLAHAPTGLLPVLMGTAGVASALVFSPTLCYAATLGGESQRGRAMALLNAAGCLGMLMGPVFAGLLAGLLRSPADPCAGYRAVFLTSGAAVWLWGAVAAAWLARRWREEGAARSRPVLALS